MALSDSGSPLTAASLRLYWEILRLRKGAEDLPVSPSLLLATIGLVVAAGLLIVQLAPEPGSHSAAVLAIDTTVMLLWGRIVLQAVRRPERYLQTMTAIFGVQLVLQPLLAPIAWFYARYSADPNLGFIAVSLLMMIKLWALVAEIRIVRSATGWTTFPCVLAAICQEMVTLMIAIALFPDLLKQD